MNLCIICLLSFVGNSMQIWEINFHITGTYLSEKCCCFDAVMHAASAERAIPGAERA